MRRVEVTYIGFDGQTHRGDLIVHEDLADEVIAIFDQLLQLRYPIEKIRTVDTYPGADDELSIEDNNTSAFNCRDIPGTGRWSQHAFGRAIDLNPLLNPEIDRTGAIQPKIAAPYVDRRRTDAGILHAALSFNLASPESSDNRPVFAQLMLDEAFSKSDPQFAQQALQAFRKFGFQLVIVATVQNATTIQPYIDSVVMVSKTEPSGRNARPVASVATRTISEFTTLRQEMRKTAGRVPAGV